GLTAYDPRIAPMERWQWSWAAATRTVRGSAVAGLVVGAPVGLAAGLVAGLTVVSGSHATAAILFGVGTGTGATLGVALAVVLVVAATSGLQTRPYTIPLAPGEGIRQSKRNAVITASVAGSVSLIGVVTFTLLSIVLYVVSDRLPGSRFTAAILGLLILGLSA